MDENSTKNTLMFPFLSTDNGIPPSQLFFERGRGEKLMPIYTSAALFCKRLREYLTPFCFVTDFRGNGWTLFLRLRKEEDEKNSVREDAIVVLDGWEGPGVLWRNQSDIERMSNVERAVFVNVRAKRPSTSSTPEIIVEVVCRHVLAINAYEATVQWILKEYPEAEANQINEGTINVAYSTLETASQATIENLLSTLKQRPKNKPGNKWHPANIWFLERYISGNPLNALIPGYIQERKKCGETLSAVDAESYMKEAIKSAKRAAKRIEANSG